MKKKNGLKISCILSIYINKSTHIKHNTHNIYVHIYLYIYVYICLWQISNVREN